ncbi:MAG: PHP domain-containing protein, partial [candidate division Zixibacteria bacterium]|nr:PHP domain-containing protein [candidate division Zixibacteria bacterium]
MTIDLHMHTNASDGLLTARELLVLVREARLLAFSITDHDTLEGYRAALKLLEPDDPELISGVELSVQAGEDDMHMLAYLFDPDNADFNAALTEFLEARNRRGRRIVEKLRDMGLSVPFSAVEQEAGNSAMGRPHI